MNPFLNHFKTMKTKMKIFFLITYWSVVVVVNFVNVFVDTFVVKQSMSEIKPGVKKNVPFKKKIVFKNQKIWKIEIPNDEV